MNFRPAISAPLPWLTMLAGRFLSARRGRRRALKRPIVWFPRSLRVTRAGKWFIALLLVIGVAAINTGNNLLYLVLATLLSLIIISGLMSECTLRGIKAGRTLPRHIFRGLPAPVRLKVENGKRYLSSISFETAEKAQGGLSAGAAYFVKVRAGGSEARTVEYTFKRRGLYSLEGIKVSTRFPFGLFLKGKVERDLEQVIVYPRIKPGAAPPEPARSLSGYGRRSFKRGAGSELYNLRDYTFQDDSRLIHWRSAAKTGSLMVREFEKESEKRVFIYLENRLAEGNEARLEEVIEEAAGVMDWFFERGWAVGLKTLDTEIPAGAGREHFFTLLRTLAVAGPSSEGAPLYRVFYP